MAETIRAGPAAWIARVGKPGVEVRVRAGAAVVRILVRAYDAKTAQNWLWGSCTALDGRAPIGALRSAKKQNDLEAVSDAALAWVHDPGM